MRTDGISVTVSLPFWTAYRAHFQLCTRYPLQIVAFAGFPAFEGYDLCFGDSGSHIPIPGKVFLWLLSCFFMPILTVIGLFSLRRSNPSLKGPLDYNFDEEGLHITGETFANSFKWVSVKKVLESGGFIFFVLGPNREISIPIPRLQAAGCLEALRELATRKVSATTR